MFSSNQEFRVSCTKEQLPGVVELVMNMYKFGTEKRRVAYQLTESGTLAIGYACDSIVNEWRANKDTKKGWTPFPGEISTTESIVSFIVFMMNEVRNSGYKPEPIGWDGTTKPGYLIESMPHSFAEKTEDGIYSPMYGIFTVKPFEVFYHK